MYEGCLEMIKTCTLLRKKNKSLKLNLIFFFQEKHKNFEVSDVIRSIPLSLQTMYSVSRIKIKVGYVHFFKKTRLFLLQGSPCITEMT